MKKYLSNAMTIMTVMSVLVLTVAAQIKTGGYKSVATDDERVVAAATFAVEKRVETHTEQEGLMLDSVDKAEMQVVAGINYKICMTISLDEESQQVQAVVFQNLKKAYSLTSWEVVETCGDSGDENASADKGFFQNHLRFTAQDIFSNLF